MSSGNGYWNSQEERILRLEDEASDSKAKQAEYGSDLKLILHRVSVLSEDMAEIGDTVKESLLTLDARVDVLTEKQAKIDTINESRSKWADWSKSILAAVIIALGSSVVTLIIERLKGH